MTNNASTNNELIIYTHPIDEPGFPLIVIISFCDNIIYKRDNMTGILETLFSSRVRARLLALLFLSPDDALNAHEISLRLGETYSVVWKELAR
ncbi:MAG: hypothetical protein AAGU05_12920, partial [Anaerolineaceae bacterium]